jgi:hypothetical protein
MAKSAAADFTVGKIQKDWGQRVAKMYGQQKSNIIHTSSTAYEQPSLCRRAAEQRDELAPFHSIASSARPSSIGGHVESDSWNETIWDM